MHARPLRVAIAALLAAASPLRAQELPQQVRARIFAPTADVSLSSTIVRVPMKGTDRAGNRKCPYFQVYVNGKGPFTFLYDTGASYTVVSTAVVEAARPSLVFDRHGKRNVVQLDRLTLGGVALGNVWAIHSDDAAVDGIIGFPTLGTSNVLFDFSRREILVSNKRIPMRNSFALPYEAPSNVPTVPVRIGGRMVPILIDTGDDAYALEIRTNELGSARLERGLVRGATVMNGKAEQSTSVAVLKEAVSLGPYHARHARIGINDDLPVGDLGYDALAQFRFQIEPQRHVVEFQPMFRGKRFKLSVVP